MGFLIPIGAAIASAFGGATAAVGTALGIGGTAAATGAGSAAALSAGVASAGLGGAAAGGSILGGLSAAAGIASAGAGITTAVSGAPKPPTVTQATVAPPPGAIAPQGAGGVNSSLAASSPGLALSGTNTGAGVTSGSKKTLLGQ